MKRREKYCKVFEMLDCIVDVTAAELLLNFSVDPVYSFDE